MYNLSESEILEIIDKAIDFGIETLNGEKNLLAIQIASFWIEGYIYGNELCLTGDDIKSLRHTINTYYFT